MPHTLPCCMLIRVCVLIRSNTVCFTGLFRYSLAQLGKEQVKLCGNRKAQLSCVCAITEKKYESSSV